MAEIKDFQCTYDNSAGINSEVTRGLGLTFPDAYLRGDTMAALSRALKEHDKAAFCELPFCHTVEAEAMGGIINYGNEVTGPRAKEYICTAPEELLDLPEIDFSKGTLTYVDIDFTEYRKQTETKTVLRNVSLPDWLSHEAEHAGINISKVLQDALVNLLHVKQNL